MPMNDGQDSNPRRKHAGPGGVEETRRVEVVVVALIPEYRQVRARDEEGHLYALTSHTSGIDLTSLHEGQKLTCIVTRRLPRVLSASTIL